MDKITRVLMLYSILADGGKVNKSAFCAGQDCHPRAFDRDIEDVRLFLSETFSGRELIYDRAENVYYLSGTQRIEIEPFEYKLIERVLVDSRILRKDELQSLLKHLASNAEKSVSLTDDSQRLMARYVEPAHGKSLIKVHGDLSVVIKNQYVIRLHYVSEDNENAYTEIEVVPCELFHHDGGFYLLACSPNHAEAAPRYYRLERIESFVVQRRQTAKEIRRAENCLKRTNGRFDNSLIIE